MKNWGCNPTNSISTNGGPILQPVWDHPGRSLRSAVWSKMLSARFMISLIWVGLHFWTQDGYRNVPYMWTTKCDFYMFSTLIYPCLCTLPRIWICSYGTVYQRRWTCVTFQQIFSQRSGRMLTAHTCEGIDITIDANLLRAAFLWRQWLESKIGLDILTRKLISFWNGLFSKDTLIFGGVFGRLTATFGQFPSKKALVSPWLYQKNQVRGQIQRLPRSRFNLLARTPRTEGWWTDGPMDFPKLKCSIPRM